ncbi:hypothetical protein [Streptomyces sp. NPDC002889]|uniref:hypothetical protein n=1 Tax=Streptomyces sp. NPDC002889 TaxID=3364669 RepID=UPI00368D4971
MAQRMVNQAALDTLPATADSDVQGRSVSMLAADDPPIHQVIEPDDEAGPRPESRQAPSVI